ncbi:MAG: hypothetical protein AAFW69_07365, partial [Pseudomonadota bacterium]
DAHRERRGPIGGYLRVALQRLPALFLLTLVVLVAAVAAGVLLIVPGLYVMAVFAVVLQVALFEGAGFGALRRSVDLTRGYRWTILGAILLYFVVVFAIGLLLAVVTAVLVFGLGAGGANELGAIVYLSLGLGTILNAALICIGASFFALIYLRLLELKEGHEREDLADVFR